MAFYVYILYSEKCDKYYVGQTADLDKRIKERNTGKGGAFSSSCSTWNLAYHETFQSRSEAVRREKEIKYKKVESILSN